MLNLAPKCRAEFSFLLTYNLRGTVGILLIKKYAKRVPVSSFSDLEKCAQVGEVTAKVMYQFHAKQVKAL